MNIQKLVDQLNVLKGYISGLEWVIAEAKKEAELNEKIEQNPDKSKTE